MVYIWEAYEKEMEAAHKGVEKLTDKVREKKMGELFADMEKMDIQAERKNTADARKEADEERRRADEAEQYAVETQKRAEEAQKRADEAEENSIKSITELCQELGMSKDSTVAKLMEKLRLSPEEAWKKADLYWKE